jgi:hypothetical protein
MGNMNRPKFRPGERVAYISGDDAILGRVDEILLSGDVYVYRILWDDLLPDREMRPEPNFRKVVPQ